MTAKRDLKKRIRDRQAKTGESYTTARRHVLAARHSSDGPAGEAEDLEVTNPGIAGDGIAAAREPPDVNATSSQLEAEWRGFGGLASSAVERSHRPIQVDEVIDVTETARAVGFACRVLMYERLTKAADPETVVKAVRDALAAMTAYPTAILRAIIAGDAPRERHRAVPRDPEFMQRITLGLTTMSSDGRMIAVQVNGYAGMLTVVCAAWRQAKTLIMTTVEDRVDHVIAGIGAMARESLFLVYEGRRYPVKREPFVIGRSKVCDLRIRDGCVSRRHAAVMYKNGRYYIVDLESQAGIEYRGMKIRNKRIEEGDMFKLHEYALRFTFHETDA